MTVTNAISDTTENNILKLIFNATAWANVAQNGTTPDASTALALHSSDPGDSGNMSINEVTTAAYTGYVRASKLRATGAGGWTVTTNSVSPFDTIAFPAGTAGSTGVSATHFSVGKLGGGTSEMFWRGDIQPPIACGNGVTPQLTTGTTITLD
ncbi:MAG: hypothetical protein ABWY82_14380 [Tardiphaga sp.]